MQNPIKFIPGCYFGTKPRIAESQPISPSEPKDHVVFMDDGLARGAAVMARCMNSMGVPKNPIVGIRGGGCVLNQRIEYYKKSKERNTI